MCFMFLNLRKITINFGVGSVSYAGMWKDGRKTGILQNVSELRRASKPLMYGVIIHLYTLSQGFPTFSYDPIQSFRGSWKGLFFLLESDLKVRVRIMRSSQWQI